VRIANFGLRRQKITAAYAVETAFLTLKIDAV